MIKLVALDLDGTIVNEHLEISETTLAMLNRIQQEAGVKVVIATGRMFPSTIPFARRIGLKDPVISYQGAMIRDIADEFENILHHPILFHQTLDVDAVKAIIQLIEAEGYHANMYVNDNLYTTHLNTASVYYQSISGVTPQSAPNLLEVLTAPPSKIMIIDDKAPEIVQMLKERFPGVISACTSRHNFCEIVHASVSKWEAIKHLMARWNIQQDEVMCIGDQENDLSMITGAGVGVAMGNAPDHVKAQANYVTDTITNNGAAKSIEKFVFGHLPLDDVSSVGSSAK
jgi:Cof subfamily protein (haloacid dehalogenase superfamily)